jgi:hypothetical protein
MADAGVVPTCDVIRGMFATANVAVSSVVDETANVQHAVARGTLAYRILRHCTVSVPGRRTTSVVEIDGPGTVQLLSAFKALGIDCTDLPIARGYWDASFICPGPGSYYGLVGSYLIHIGPFFGVTDVEHVAQNLLRALT